MRALAILVLLLLGSAGQAAEPARLDWASLPLPGIEGAPLPPDQFRGKVVLVVNTASFCGYTYQFKALEQLWTRYKARGFVLLGVPSNDFGGQEPGSDQSIKEFCEANFDVDFPMLAKQTVRGAGAHPLFRFFRTAGGGDAEPRWNFHKYLVGRDGRLIGWFPSSIEPDAPRLLQALEQALAATS